MVMAFLAGFNNSAICRLYQTKQLIPKKFLEVNIIPMIINFFIFL